MSMSKTAAMKQATDESTMIKYGPNEWILSMWSEQFNAWYQGHSRSYSKAQFDLTNWRFCEHTLGMGTDYRIA